MEKRSAARELAFLTLFQLPKNPDKIDINKLSETDFHAICLSAIRTLSEHAKENIKKAESNFIKTERYLMEHQINHPENEQLDEATRSVPLPGTTEFIDHLNNCYQAIALTKEALNIPEIYWHYQDNDIQEFTITLLILSIENRKRVQELIQEISKSWDIERMHKVDKVILELAASEIVSSDLPAAVVVSEAMKLANKYSTPEGEKFINGILGDIVKSVQI